MINNTEINEAVARKLGGERRILPDAVLMDGTVIKHYPNYSGSIAAAWEIVEHVQWYTMWRDEQGVHFWIRSGPGPDNELVSACANTVPLAICKAFLKLDK